MSSTRPTDSAGSAGDTASFVPQTVSVHVNRSAERAVRQGQLWVFQEAVERVRGDGEAGDVAVLYGASNKPMALGLYDPESPIRVRVLHHGMGVSIDAAWMQASVERAYAKRVAVFDARTTGYRVIHGPGDGMPGLVVDRYANTLVIKLYSAAWLPWLDTLTDALMTTIGAKRLILRLNRQLQDRPEVLAGRYEGQILAGPPLTGTFPFLENGVVFEVDPIRGQKTGFFLDQRENRERVEALASGRRTLNVFSYTGGFSLYAARGGAGVVASVDASRTAMDAWKRNVALNTKDPAITATRFDDHCGDAFEVFAALQEAGARYELVIVDPPSFAKRASEVEGALRAYRRLARLAVPLATPDAIVVFASCSSRVNHEAFEAAICAGALDAGMELDIFERAGHPIDHPIAYGELQYLKCFYARLKPAPRRRATPAARQAPTPDRTRRSGSR